jgi:signal transduction histidine kinase
MLRERMATSRIIHEGAQAADVRVMRHLDEATAYWQWDITRDIVAWSAPLYGIAGRDPDIPLPPFREHGRFYTSDSWHRLVSAVLKVFTTGAPFRIELGMVRPDHTIRRISCSGEAVRDADQQIVRLRGLVEEIPEPMVGAFAEELIPRNRPVGPAAVDSLINAYENELARVSRQLREDICQRLSLIVIEAQQLRPPDPEVTTEQPIPVDGLWQHIDETLSRVYGLAEEIRPYVLDLLGLRQAVRGLCREYSNLWRIRTECTVSIAADIESRVALIFFRICQAALRDIEITGSPRNLAFEVARNGSDLLLRMIVNGEGVTFKTENGNPAGGFALASIKEQIQLMGGELVFWSDPSLGAQLEARAPLTQASSVS